MLEGQRALSLQQLAARFGALPSLAAARIETVTAEPIVQGSLRLLTAASLEESPRTNERTQARPSRVVASRPRRAGILVIAASPARPRV